MASPDLAAIVASLATERTVDIVTTGRRTGLARVTEIWTTLIDGVLYVCGTPSAGPEAPDPQPRDWLANLRADSAFTLRLKQSVAIDLPARAIEVHDPEERLRLLESPQSAYYREFSPSVEDFVAYAPVMRVELLDEFLASAMRFSRANGPT